MGLCLIADTSFLLDLASWLLNILKVFAGLGAVIFVHELGHFLVAKACGVKCEKFYVGFDVPIKIFGFALPRTFWKQKWGETEYGIGIIPLGGYVKMLGQDDNPANYEAEAERTRIRQPGEGVASDTAGADAAAVIAQAAGSSPTERDKALGAGTAAEGLVSGQTVEQGHSQPEYQIDPRSYTAKSVPQRMAIISAGVLMNLVFAVIFATLAYRMGVKYTPCVIGSTIPGSPAWQADLQPGSRIVQIGKKGHESRHLRFQMDLLQNVGISGASENLDLLIQEPGKDGKKNWVAIRPKPMKVGNKSFPTIGIRSAATTTLPGDLDTPPVIPQLPAGSAKPPFAGGDKIVAVKVGGTVLPVPDYFHLRAILAQHVDDELTFVVERKVETGETGAEAKDAPTTKVDITVAANPMRRVGLVMTLGPISAIQEDSPAAAAGFQVGDQIKTINGQPADDPLTISDVLQRLAGQEVEVGVLRDTEIVNLSVTPRLPIMQISYANTGLPLGIQPLGVACPVLNRVSGVEPGSPAAKAGLKPGDELMSASFVAVDDARRQEEEKLGLGAKAIGLGKEQNWLLVFERMQRSLPDTQLKLTYQRDSQDATVELTPSSSPQWHVASRGFFLQADSEIHTAESWGEAFSLGLRNTKESMLHVVKFLRKLVTGQISVTNVGGPAVIFMVAGSEAKQGIPRLLLFLTLLSANLAIINFLPIPVLDGGHMLFLLYEGIVGKPVNEVWAMRLTVAGLVFILGLMALVLSLDAFHIAQWFSQ